MIALSSIVPLSLRRYDPPKGSGGRRTNTRAAECSDERRHCAMWTRRYLVKSHPLLSSDRHVPTSPAPALPAYLLARQVHPRNCRPGTISRHLNGSVSAAGAVRYCRRVPISGSFDGILFRAAQQVVDRGMGQMNSTIQESDTMRTQLRACKEL